MGKWLQQQRRAGHFDEREYKIELLIKAQLEALRVTRDRARNAANDKKRAREKLHERHPGMLDSLMDVVTAEQEEHLRCAKKPTVEVCSIGFLSRSFQR